MEQGTATDLLDPGPEGFLNRRVLRQTSPELARLVAEKDWSKTPLGPVDRWSPALRTMVEHLLGNGFGLLLWWGPQFCQIYNDAYRPVLGTKHPHSLGQPASECWAEIWDTIGPMIEQPFRGGPPSTMEDLHLELNRYGYVEETHFTVAYSPVFDETAESGIGGVLATVQETTTKVIGERRIRLLSELGTRTAEGRTAEEVCEIAADVLATDARDVSFALLYLLERQGKHAKLIAVTGAPPSGVSVPAELAIDDDSVWPISQLIASDQMVTIPPAGGNAAAALVPIRSTLAHELSGFLVMGTSPVLSFDDSYARFFDLIAAPIATAITNARAYEEERRRAEALAELDRSKNVFFSNVSHEFRTPLTLMLGPLEELAKLEDEQVRSLAEPARRNSLRLLKLVNTLLEFARLESGRVDAAFAPTDLAALTRDLSSVFRSAIEAAGLRLELEVDLRERVYVDRSMWERIVLNLLSNALKFTLEGCITVALHRRGDCAELAVIDTGIGIPPESIPHVFERFRRVRDAKARSIEGSGIGLALVHDLVELHGGSIDVESVVGAGTAFRILIPLGSAHLDPAQIVTGEAPSSINSSVEQYLADVSSTMAWTARPRPKSPAPSAGARILLADDNGDLREYVARILSSRYDVVAVKNGLEALEAARDDHFDLIISDVMMPEMDGFELLRAVKNDERLRALPFIMLSARAGEESAIEGLSAGADDYLIKPFSADELRARVGANLNAAFAREEALGRWFERSGDGEGNELAFRVFANQLPIMIWQHDVTGAVSFANAAWYRTLNLPREPESLSAEAWKKVIHPEDFPRALHVASDGIESRSEYEVEYRLKPAGAPDEAYRWYIARAVPQFDRDGVFRGWIGSIVDVHDAHLREDTERQLRSAAAEGERELRALAEAIPVIVWTADTSGAITWYNHGWCDYTGQTREEAAGWGWQAALHPEDLPRVMQEWPHSIATGEPFESEYRLRLANGTYHTVLARAVPIQDEHGTIVRWYGSNVDIEAQREALERSKRVAETLQGIFLPEQLPHTERMRVDAVYQAAERALIGGDWFDAVRLRDGRHLVSIGDVAGHGLDSSVIAGRLRHAITDFALENDSPEAILRCANHILRLEYPDMFATAVVGLIDPSCSTFSYASAGHQPPLIARSRHAPAEILPYGGLPLGVEDNLDLESHTIELHPDDVLALYTDGLTEFAHDIESAEERLKTAVAQIVGNTTIARPAAAVRDAVLEGVPTTDDAALLIVQFSKVTAEALEFDPTLLEKTWRFHSSDAYTAHTTRESLMKFIRHFAADPDALFTAELIVGEILANTVEHAPGLVELHVDWSAQKPLVTVRDTGPGLSYVLTELPEDALNENGRGLFLVKALSEDLTIAQSPTNGTELRATLPVTKQILNLSP